MGAAEDHYRGAAGREYQHGKRAVPSQAFSWVSRSRVEKFREFVRADDVVVEFGAGLGWNLVELKCGRKIGTDLENHLPAESGIEFHAGPEGIPNATANVVICHHVLEHVANPPEMIAQARRILRPDGALLVNVPFEKERRYRQFDPAEPNHHLYSWNVQTLGNLLTDCGFHVTQLGLHKFGYDRAAAAAAIRFGLGETGFRLLRIIALTVLPAFEIRAVAKSR